MILRSYDDVRRLTAYLQTVADWKQGFERRAEDAQHRLEAVGLDLDAHDQLLEEGRALQLLMDRLLGAHAAPERRAA